ncbi:hypothetical protein BD408DRAFT_424524 [Parasitella parasitica]|nr:hypothetical protein BD408DRAFT_424524 [Parasitella parasitica]
MKMTFTLFAASLVAIAFSMPLSDEDSHDNLSSLTCEPNTEFRIDCNLCLCSPDGTGYACSVYKCTQDE